MQALLVGLQGIGVVGQQRAVPGLAEVTADSSANIILTPIERDLKASSSFSTTCLQCKNTDLHQNHAF